MPSDDELPTGARRGTFVLDVHSLLGPALSRKRGHARHFHGSAILVTAHPDDEAMFFAPALLALSSTLQLHVLCLSTGNYDGLGALRAVELPRACACLGVPAERVRIVEDPLLQDGPATDWPAERIADIVEAELQATGATRVITFDAQGVSRHANHVGVHRGVRLLAHRQRHEYAAGASSVSTCCSSPPVLRSTAGTTSSSASQTPSSSTSASRPPPLEVFELRSTGLVQRHLGWCAVLLTLISWWLRLHVMMPRVMPTPSEEDRVVVCVSLQPWVVHRAMVQHHSQYVWFRRLYVLVSRYVWVNELVRTK